MAHITLTDTTLPLYMLYGRTKYGYIAAFCILNYNFILAHATVFWSGHLTTYILANFICVARCLEYSRQSIHNQGIFRGYSGLPAHVSRSRTGQLGPLLLNSWGVHNPIGYLDVSGNLLLCSRTGPVLFLAWSPSRHGTPCQRFLSGIPIVLASLDAGQKRLQKGLAKTPEILYRLFSSGVVS